MGAGFIRMLALHFMFYALSCVDGCLMTNSPPPGGEGTGLKLL